MVLCADQISLFWRVCFFVGEEQHRQHPQQGASGISISSVWWCSVAHSQQRLLETCQAVSEEKIPGVMC